jgi:DNA-binding GntR family transcriptional regulator
VDIFKVADDFDAFYTLNREFHDSIMDFAENDRLWALCDGLVKELHLYRSRSLLEGGRLRVSNCEHRQILTALESGNAKTVELALEPHIQAGKRRFFTATNAAASDQPGN